MSHPHPRAIPPFSIEKLGNSFAVVDRTRINWGTDTPGAVLFRSEDDARVWCAEHKLEMK